MAMYVYSTVGRPVGFVFGNFIHDLTGEPLGRIVGTRVHRMDGSYVGEWFKEGVVAQPSARPRDIVPIAAPSRQPSPGASFNRRGVVDYGLQDVFHLLYEKPGGEGTSLDLAAE